MNHEPPPFLRSIKHFGALCENCDNHTVHASEKKSHLIVCFLKGLNALHFPSHQKYLQILEFRILYTRPFLQHFRTKSKKKKKMRSAMVKWVALKKGIFEFYTQDPFYKI